MGCDHSSSLISGTRVLSHPGHVLMEKPGAAEARAGSSACRSLGPGGNSPGPRPGAAVTGQSPWEPSQGLRHTHGQPVAPPPHPLPAAPAPPSAVTPALRVTPLCDTPRATIVAQARGWRALCCRAGQPLSAVTAAGVVAALPALGALVCPWPTSVLQAVATAWGELVSLCLSFTSFSSSSSPSSLNFSLSLPSSLS